MGEKREREGREEERRGRGGGGEERRREESGLSVKVLSTLGKALTEQ